MKTLPFSLSPHLRVSTRAGGGPSPCLRVSASSFNPVLPLDGSLVVADVLRDQFNGLAALIAAVTSVDAAVVDGVQTLNPGDPATVALTVNAETLHFLFGIPRGNEGVPGTNGTDGAPGPPFANAVVDGVTTLPPGAQAWVTVSFDGSLVHFSYGIPAGEAGVNGEVTNAQLSEAISGTSTNSNAVMTLGMVVSDPPTQAEMQTLANKMDELILALRR